MFILHHIDEYLFPEGRKQILIKKALKYILFSVRKQRKYLHKTKISQLSSKYVFLLPALLKGNCSQLENNKQIKIQIFPVMFCGYLFQSE